MMRTERFYKKPEQSTSVEILNEQRISGGLYGDIFDVTASINGKERRFIQKKFNERPLSGGGKRSPEEKAVSAFNNHTRAKELGAKVLPTYRISEDKKSVLMTFAHSDDITCIGTNTEGSRLSDFNKPKIIALPGFEDFVRTYLEHARETGEKRMLIDSDAYFILVDDSEDDVKLDFVVGDMDNIEFDVSEKHIGTNIAKAKRTLDIFLYKNVEDPSGFFKDELKRIYDEFMAPYRKK